MPPVSWLCCSWVPLGLARLGLALLQELQFESDSSFACLLLTFVRIGFDTHTRLELGRRACVFCAGWLRPTGTFTQTRAPPDGGHSSMPTKATQHSPRALPPTPLHHCTHKCDKASWLDPMFIVRLRMFCFGAAFTTTTARLHNRLSATNTVMSPS